MRVGKMLLNGFPPTDQTKDNIQQESDVFQTPPHTPRQQNDLGFEDGLFI